MDEDVITHPEFLNFMSPNNTPKLESRITTNLINFMKR
jgi:hypothetical protein